VTRLAAALLAPLVAALGAPSLAGAQWAALDRQDGTMKANLATSLVIDTAYLDVVADDGTTQSNVFILNELYLQGVYKGIGGYIAIPYAASTNGSVANNAMGNIELGALWDVAFPVLSLTLRGGVGIPIAGSDEYLQTTLGVADWARIGDAALTYPDIVSTRLSGSVRVPMGILNARADVGVDLLIPIGDGTDASDFNTIFRFNLGLQLLWKGFGGTLEYAVSTLVVDSKVSFDAGTAFPQAFVVSLRAETRYIDIYVAGTVPLTSGFVGDVGAVSIGFTTMWGFEGDTFAPVDEFFN
jgi:hypothetical protein